MRNAFLVLVLLAGGSGLVVAQEQPTAAPATTRELDLERALIESETGRLRGVIDNFAQRHAVLLKELESRKAQEDAKAKTEKKVEKK